MYKRRRKSMPQHMVLSTHGEAVFITSVATVSRVNIGSIIVQDMVPVDATLV